MSPLVLSCHGHTAEELGNKEEAEYYHNSVLISTVEELPANESPHQLRKERLQGASGPLHPVIEVRERAETFGGLCCHTVNLRAMGSHRATLETLREKKSISLLKHRQAGHETNTLNLSSLSLNRWPYQIHSEKEINC